MASDERGDLLDHFRSAQPIGVDAMVGRLLIEGGPLRQDRLDFLQAPLPRQ
jgi:hypothetical protein